MGSIQGRHRNQQISDRLGSVAGGAKTQIHDNHEDCSNLTAWDDVTGEQLNPKLVLEARLKEISYIHTKGVWRKMPRTQAKDMGLKIIGARWIDIDKGSIDDPNYRSRLVAK